MNTGGVGACEELVAETGGGCLCLTWNIMKFRACVALLCDLTLFFYFLWKYNLYIEK